MVLRVFVVESLDQIEVIINLQDVQDVQVRYCVPVVFEVLQKGEIGGILEALGLQKVIERRI